MRRSVAARVSTDMTDLLFRSPETIPLATGGGPPVDKSPSDAAFPAAVGCSHLASTCGQSGPFGAIW
jgi:hypothetical protein